jgi:hypothetical protein
VILAYRPLSSGLTNTAALCEILRTMDTNNVMIGDINMPGIQWEMELLDAKGRDLLETITEEGLKQLVSFPPHVKGNVLDLLITNCSDRIINVAVECRLGKGDHCILNIEIECCIHQTQQETIRYNWRKADVTKKGRSGGAAKERKAG